MTENSATVAPLRNVVALLDGAERALHRPAHLPGLVVMYGPSGYGKSWSAVAAMNTYRAYYVEVRSTWTRKHLAEAILRQMGLATAGTIPVLVERIGDHLLQTGRMLIVDEADYLVQRGMIEIIRDLYEHSGAPIILVGEEHLPTKLLRWERVHGRVLVWVMAQPGDRADAASLARMYCPGFAIADDLLSEIVKAAAGSIRRICVNLDRVREAALTDPPPAGGAGMAWWRDRELYRGQPARRS